MDFRVENINVKLIRACSNITFSIPVSSSHPIKVGDEHIVTNIKLTIVVQHGPIDIHLNNIGTDTSFVFSNLPSASAGTQTLIDFD